MHAVFLDKLHRTQNQRAGAGKKVHGESVGRVDRDMEDK